MKLKKIIIKVLFTGYILLTFGCYYTLAVNTSVWEQSSYMDFGAGKPKDVSLTSENQLTLSKALTPVEGNISELRVWCLVNDSQGNIYAGTGDKGKIFKISKDGQISLLFDSPETDILSLIIDSKDNIYAGSSPDGIIYKIEPDRVPATFFKSEEKYVWSLAFDSSGNLYAGTGINGKIYKISPDGKGEVVYDSTETHIKCLLSSGCSIYAGGEGSGIIYKISSDGKAFVLYDTSENEISSLVMGSDGNIYASAVAGEAGPPAREQQEQGAPPLKTGGKPGGKERRSLIYQITPDGVATEIWESPDPIVYTLMVDGENIIAGTGSEGNIYSVKSNGDWIAVTDCGESQVLAIYKVNSTDEIWIATGNPAKIYKLSVNYVKEGTLESQKWDASVISKWGSISWDTVTTGNTGMTLSTHTGNTEKPDDTWSAWSEEYSDANGSAITSPPARFIQWRVKLTSTDGTATPMLKSVSVSYLQKNLKPSIDTVVIASEQEKPGGPPRKPQIPGADGDDPSKSDNTPINGKRVINWQAKDPNSDSLEYSVYFRGTEEQNWKLLKDEIKNTSYPLDTESFPDGAYFVKVVAIDSPDNPKDIALSEEKISNRFVIDNTPPAVVELQTTQSGNDIYVITGRTEDIASYIKNIVYSIDGGDWKPLFPSDQVFDSKKEIFSFSTDQLKAGEHTVVIKATDAAGNVGSAKTVVPMK
jgi:hypothetical protein